jgi:hypothetical protein
MGRLYAVIPDDVARSLAVASRNAVMGSPSGLCGAAGWSCLRWGAAREGTDPEARGTFFESDAHPADS